MGPAETNWKTLHPSLSMCDAEYIIVIPPEKRKSAPHMWNVTSWGKNSYEKITVIFLLLNCKSIFLNFCMHITFYGKCYADKNKVFFCVYNKFVEPTFTNGVNHGMGCEINKGNAKKHKCVGHIGQFQFGPGYSKSVVARSNMVFIVGGVWRLCVWVTI